MSESEHVERRALNDLASQLAVAVGALTKYKEEYCEGWCEGGPRFHFDCGGCVAGKAIASLPARAKALREVVERLTLIRDSFGSCAEIGDCTKTGYPREDWCAYCLANEILAKLEETP